MEQEGILLRQTQHMEKMIAQLNNQKFAEIFGDIKFVFADGDIYFYKALLSEMSQLA